MRVSLTVGVFCLHLTACGGSATSAARQVVLPTDTSPAHGYVRGDQDGEAEVHGVDPDDARVRRYGHHAGVVDRRTITALLKRYYAAAAAGDLATVCSLTFSGLVRSSSLLDAVPEDYAPVPGSPSLRGKNCKVVLSVLTKERHEELVADRATLVVIDVRVRGGSGLALLGFSTTGERYVSLVRQRGAWKVDGLFDSGVP